LSTFTIQLILWLVFLQKAAAQLKAAHPFKLSSPLGNGQKHRIVRRPFIWLDAYRTALRLLPKVAWLGLIPVLVYMASSGNSENLSWSQRPALSN